ncbi:MAG: hypothetical protein KDD55_06015 [Bdellovibrionales bacterium]|nr:hypothetical protein [Bdellovibrionales bacterium]
MEKITNAQGDQTNHISDEPPVTPSTRTPFFNRERVGAWGLVLSLATLTGISLHSRGSSDNSHNPDSIVDTFRPLDPEKYEQALHSLLAESPRTPVLPVEALGLHEVIPLRSASQTALSPKELQSYLAILLSQGKHTEVLSFQGEYKLQKTPTGEYIPDPIITTLQELVMGKSDADGLFGTNTGKSFYSALIEINNLRALPHKIALPSQPSDLNLTVSMAAALMDWAVNQANPDSPPLQEAIQSEDTALFLDELLHSPAYLAGSTLEQQQILEIFHATTLEGRAHLVNLCHRDSPDSHRPTLFEIATLEGTESSTLHSLASLCTLPMRAHDDVHRDKIIEGALAELDPFNINQGSWNRCGADVIDFNLHLRYPALAACITARVFDARCSKLGEFDIEHGDVYHPQAYISPTESRRQATFMEAANGTLDYDPTVDCNLDPTSHERVYSGLYSQGISDLMSTLSGDTYVCYSSYDSILPPTLCLLLKLLQQGDMLSYLDRYMTESEMNALSNRERQGRAEIRTSHIVSFWGYDSVHSEVLLRTWGKTTRAQHEVIPSENGSLEMRVEDPNRGIYAVKLSVLVEHIQSVIARVHGDLPEPKDLKTL